MKQHKLRREVSLLISEIKQKQKELEATIEAIYRLEHNFPRNQDVNLTWQQMAHELDFVI